MKKKVACLGPSGSFSEKALLEVMSADQIDFVFTPCLSEVLGKLEEGEADFAWLPWWNSGYGFLPDQMGREFLLTAIRAKKTYEIIAENFMPLDFALMGVSGSSLDDIKTVYVNPYAQSLCKVFFKQHPDWEVVVKDSSSEAAKQVVEQQDSTIAASAGCHAAAKFGLDILQKTMLAPEEQAMMQFVLFDLSDKKATIESDYYTTSCVVECEEVERLVRENISISRQVHSKKEVGVCLLDLEGKVERETLEKILGDSLLHSFGYYPTSNKRSMITRDL